MVFDTNTKVVNCCLIGDGMVGKSSLARAFIGERFTRAYMATVMDRYYESMNVLGDRYTVEVIDCAGQHEYESMRSVIYKESEVYIICFNVADRESYNGIRDFWIPEIRQEDRKRPIILVATQVDKRKKSNLCVTKTQGQELAKELKADHYVECSVSKHTGVRDVFNSVVLSAIKRRKRRSSLIRRVLAR